MENEAFGLSFVENTRKKNFESNLVLVLGTGSRPQI